jgi:hypothetical protein
MDLKNGFKVIYEKPANGERTLYATKSAKYPNRNENGVITDDVLASFVDANFRGKTVYEKNGRFYFADTNTAKFDKDGNPTGTEITFTDGVNPFIEEKKPGTEEQGNEVPAVQSEEEPEVEEPEVPDVPEDEEPEVEQTEED